MQRARQARRCFAVALSDVGILRHIIGSLIAAGIRCDFLRQSSRGRPMAWNHILRGDLIALRGAMTLRLGCGGITEGGDRHGVGRLLRLIRGRSATGLAPAKRQAPRVL